MSKIALTPSATGTGVFTISSPATNTDRTLTLPDEAGSIVVNTATGIDVTGTVTADGLTVESTVPALFLMETDQTDKNAYVRSSGGFFQIKTINDALDTQKSRLSIDHATGDISFYEDTGTTAKFFWDASAESLGIGTSSPRALFDLGSGTGDGVLSSTPSDYQIILEANASATGDIGRSIGWATGANTVSAAINSYDAGAGITNGLVFATAANGTLASRMRIDSSGNVLVGKTSASDASDGLWVTPTGSILATATSTYAAQFRRNGTDGVVVYFYNDAAFVGSINVSGSSTSYNTSSDYRLKTDAQPMVGASDRVLALKPVNFEWISSGERVDGFLAHEAQAVVPECVTGTKDAMRDEEYEVTAAVYEDIIIAAVLDEEGNELEAERTEQRLVSEAVMGTRSVPDYQGIDQSKLVPLLTAALQEALTEISALKVRVAALEAV